MQPPNRAYFRSTNGPTLGRSPPGHAHEFKAPTGPGLTRAEVESIVRQGIESITESKNGLTSANAERIARGIAHPWAAPTAETMHAGESRP